MVASIGAVVAPAQCIAYFERDYYYAKEDPNHRESSIWRGRGAEDLGLSGPVDPEVLRSVLEGVVPDGSGRRLGRPGKDGSFHHRPGRDLTLSAPKSVSLLAYLGGDGRAIWAHEVAVKRTLDWVERNAAETRMSEPGTGRSS
ncbi:MAG: relaxase domain-containing protein [Nitrospinae bacterium]|nr:relaxase domain-containing protein [Nitrospinota bacterium]